MIFRLTRLFKRLYRARGSEFTKVVVMTLVLIAYSSTGFMFFELEQKPDLLWSDAIWWSVVTMTTVGYGDFFPTSGGGRYLIGFPTMVFGISILGYLLSTVATFFIEARSKELKGMGELDLEDHVLIIHFQNLDRQLGLLKELRADPLVKDAPIVLIDDHLEELPMILRDEKVSYVRGNPTKESTLSRANFRSATRAVVLARDPNDPMSDNHNLAVALTLEQLHPEIISVAECVDPEQVELMYKAGCDSVVCLAELSSGLLVNEMLDPGLSSVVRRMTSNLSGQSFYLTRVAASDGGHFADVKQILEDQGFVPLGFKRGDDVQLNPDGDTSVYADDLVVVLGDRRPDDLKV